LPWEGRTGKLFGKATHVVDGQGYYGPADGEDANRGVRLGERLDSPDLVIQDELHLISGPLGSMAGLYEAVIDELCSHGTLRPKIVASTATVRRATEQMQALFGRNQSSIFPAPGQIGAIHSLPSPCQRIRCRAACMWASAPRAATSKHCCCEPRWR
jgi:hypothetical protein